MSIQHQVLMSFNNQISIVIFVSKHFKYKLMWPFLIFDHNKKIYANFIGKLTENRKQLLNAQRSNKKLYLNKHKNLQSKGT